MIGAIIGDIVGSRFEFNNCLRTDFEFFHPDCEFTDDTICTIAVAEWLLGENEDLASIMRRWCQQYPSSYGGMFGQWIHINSMKAYNSFGNGSAMRVSPVAWIATGQQELTWDEVKYNAERSAAITHNHPEGIKGALCIVDSIYCLRNGFSKSQVKERIEKLYGYSLDKTCDEIRETNRFDETCQVTVPQAITCFLESTGFENAIRLAVSIGGDSDTIAAITGSLAEAHYGVPEQLKRTALEYLPNDMKTIISNFETHKNGK